ncbi:MAG: B12-binding domain-containing radical SAM protein [Desulfobacterota bacterium]|nr:B12-binding domain-containing radical SAM protein [Thermodesulfobacteriota bacterium]
MKILLIQPPVRDFYHTPIRTQPIGLAYLAASLRASGYEVEILDCQTGAKKPIPIPSELSYLKEFYPFEDRSPFKLYQGFYHFGMGWEEIRKRIEASNPDLVGISSSFTPYHGEALRVSHIVKSWDPRKIVVMGGAHVCCDPEGVLKNPSVDFVILGEGEERFPALVEEIRRGRSKERIEIDGVGYRVDGSTRIHPIQAFLRDLDALPLPERSLLDIERYRIRGKRSTMLITSRGCPHGCSYCSAHLVMGRLFRARSPQNILQEMILCHTQYGIEAFDFEDDNFTFDLGRAKGLMRRIIEHFGESRLDLSAMNGLSFASLDGELLSLMRRAGFRTLNLSYVSTNPLTKERLMRPSPSLDFEAILKEVERVGLNVIAYAILGIPGQTLEEMTHTLVYLMGRRVLIGPSLYYPVPGTPLFERHGKESFLPTGLNRCRSSALPIETDSFSRLDLATLLRLARLINFLKGQMDRREMAEGMTWRELAERWGRRASGTGRNPTWEDLLSRFFEEKSFYSLVRMDGNRLFLRKEATSQRVMDLFFEEAWERPIFRSRND